MRNIFFVLLFSPFLGSAQKIFFKYYENDKERKSRNIEIIATTQIDTLKFIPTTSRIDLSAIKNDFTLYVKIENDSLKLGSFKISSLESFTEIIAGKITRFEKLKKIKDYDNSFVIGDFYPITVSNWKNADETIIGILVRNEPLTDGKMRLTNFGASNIIKFK